MSKWAHKVTITHLFTEQEDHESIQNSMNDIADELEKHSCFNTFDTFQMRRIPQGDGFFGPVDYANKIIDCMYDFADEHGIWIG